ncbi:MAG: RNAse Z [Roseivirga sp.]|nr:RNAse Z [Roseivirga sp.]
MKLTINGYSTALFATWFFVDELALLFDAGDGIASGLTQKARKVKNVFISHADRDHLAGLLAFNQLNARPGAPTIHYPKDCGSFPALESFSKKFDPHVSGTIWSPIKEYEEISLRGDVYVQAFPNEHIQVGHPDTKSLSYKVFETRRKLKPEFTGLAGLEIKKIIEEHGRDFTTDLLKTNRLSYSGDTPINYELWDGSEVLIHEATFLGGPEDAKIETHGNRHSLLEDVIKMVSEIKVGKLILSHFSSRYSPEQIDGRIRKLCKEFKLTIPVYRLLPGEIHRDILRENPVNG